jgi:hypothetical protein
MLSRISICASLVAVCLPLSASGQQRDTSGGSGPNRQPLAQVGVEPAVLRSLAPRAFQRLFSTAVQQPLLPIPTGDDTCEGWYFTPCDSATECSVDSYICEVGPRTGVAEPTWLMRCPACGPIGQE